MVTNRSYFETSRDLVRFLRDYSLVIEMQLHDVHSEMEAAVMKIMAGIEGVSSLTEAGKAAAEQTMMDVHLQPDAATSDAMDEAQAAVDAAMREALGEVEPTPEAPAQADDSNGVRRRSGRFSKNIEAVSGLAGSVARPLVSIMGALSAEDVVGQRLSHISLTVNALSMELGHLLLDINGRFNKANIDHFAASLKDFTLRQYTLPAERRLYEEAFDAANLGAVPAPTAADYPEAGGDLVEFLGFLSAFHLLLKNQLLASRASISEIVAQSMTGILDINEQMTAGKKHADEILVKKTVQSPDRAAPSSAFESVSFKHAGGDSPAPSDSVASGAPGALAKPINMLSQIDQDLGVLVINMMGELSIDDVIGQRLDHVIAALSAIEKLIRLVVVRIKAKDLSLDLAQVTGSLLEQLWLQYTMESEKQCFRKVFGQAPKAKKSG